MMQALRKLIACSLENDEDKLEMSRYAKNYLPILLNVYMSPAKGSSAEGQRLAALETIQVYGTRGIRVDEKNNISVKLWHSFYRGL